VNRQPATAQPSEAIRQPWWRVLSWEYIQNLPAAAGFVAAVPLWQEGEVTTALACVSAGAVTTSLAIWLTEPRIVPGHKESPRLIVLNAVGSAALMLALVVYLASDWARWQTDLLLGLSAGTLLAACQSWFVAARPAVRHCLALGAGASVALLAARVAVNALPAPLTVLAVTGAATVVIGLTDYGSEPAVD
jgi:hypothetical protein